MWVYPSPYLILILNFTRLNISRRGKDGKKGIQGPLVKDASCQRLFSSEACNLDFHGGRGGGGSSHPIFWV